MSHRLNDILGVVGRPAFLKEATVTEKQSDEREFADALRRRYPCGTKQAAYTSNLLALTDPGVTPQVASSLAKWATFWGVADEVAEARVKLAAVSVQVSEQELPDYDFALVADHQGTRIRKFACVDADTTVTASVAFHDARHRYPYAWRKTAAINLLARAERFDVILPDYVNRYLHKAAGFALPNADAIDNAMIQRLNMAGRSHQAEAHKLAALLDEFIEDGSLAGRRDLFAEVLETVDRFDRETKIASTYGHGLDLPEEMYGHIEPDLAKLAGCSARFVRLINGREVDINELPKHALAAVDQGLADMSLAKLAEVLPTLPKPEADLLVALMPKTAAMYGSPPVPKNSAPPTVSPSPTPAPAPAMSADDYVNSLDAPKAAKPPVPAVGNVLTDDNFNDQAAAAAQAPASPPPAPAPSFGVEVASGVQPRKDHPLTPSELMVRDQHDQSIADAHRTGAYLPPVSR